MVYRFVDRGTSTSKLNIGSIEQIGIIYLSVYRDPRICEKSICFSKYRVGLSFLQVTLFPHSEERWVDREL